VFSALSLLFFELAIAIAIAIAIALFPPLRPSDFPSIATIPCPSSSASSDSSDSSDSSASSASSASASACLNGRGACRSLFELLRG
jgi:hypothetical protein